MGECPESGSGKGSCPIRGRFGGPWFAPTYLAGRAQQVAKRGSFKVLAGSGPLPPPQIPRIRGDVNSPRGRQDIETKGCKDFGGLPPNTLRSSLDPKDRPAFSY